MDEPTNHLDIKSKNVLKEALRKFEGTLILVSHDRDFLQGLVETVYEFKDQKIKQYLGGIDYYLEQRNIENLREAEKRTVTTTVAKESNKQNYQDQKKLKSLNNRLSNIEAKINQLEKEIKNDDVALATDYEITASDPEFFNQYQSKKKRLEGLMADWETVQEDLDQIS